MLQLPTYSYLKHLNILLHCAAFKQKQEEHFTYNANLCAIICKTNKPINFKTG